MNLKTSRTTMYRNTKCCDKDMVSSTMDIKEALQPYDRKPSVPTTYSYKAKDNTEMKRSMNALSINTTVIYPHHGVQYPIRTMCYQYKKLLQRIRSLLDEIKAIRKNQATGLCEFCRRYNTFGKCKRCEILANKHGRRYGGSSSRDEEARQQRYKIWLSKVKQFLYVVLEKELCQHKLYHDKSGGADELTNLLNELRAPLNIREPCIGHFPSMESLSNLTESKDILEEVLLKLEKSEELYGPTAGAPTVGGIPCPSTCKYFSGRKFGDVSEGDDDKLYADTKTVADSKALTDSKAKADAKAKADTKVKADAIARADAKAKADANLNADAKAKADIKANADAKTLVDAKTKADGKAEGDTNTKDAKANIAKAKDDTKTKGNAKSKDDAKTKADAKSKDDAKTKTDAKSKDDAKTKGDTKSKDDAKTKADAKSKDDAKTKADAKSKDDAKTKADSKSKDDAKSKGNAKSKDNIKSKDDAQSKSNIKAKDGAQLQKEQDDKKGKNSKVADTEKSNAAEKNKLDALKSDVKSKSDAESRKKLKEASSVDLGKKEGKGKSNAEDDMLAMMIKSNTQKREPQQKKQERLPSLPSIEELPIPKPKEPKKVVEVVESIIECGLHNIKPTEMVKGINIVPIEHRIFLNTDAVKPILFKVNADSITKDNHQNESGINTDITPTETSKTKKSELKTEPNRSGKGIIRYSLSDREFIDKGWTLLPTTKIMRRMNIYKMLPRNPNLDWFKRHKKRGIILYDSCEKFAEIDENGNGKWYYKNGMLALDYYSSEEINSGHRYVVYSSGEKDAYGRKQPLTVLASFDFLGNGVVYDHFGNERLKYNQSEGVVVDSKIGPPGRWKWHTLNEPPVLQPVFLDTYVEPDSCMEKFLFSRKQESKYDASNKEPDLDMLAIELENFVKEKTSKMEQEFKPFHIKMKALKINDQFSLKVMGQSNIHLTFRDGQTTAKLDLGMLLISNEIVDTDTAEVSQVATPYDRYPPKSQSIADVQNILENARKLIKLSSRLRD